MTKRQISASMVHQRVPPDWYYKSISKNLLQRFWHTRRFREVGNLIEPTGGRILDIGSADGMFTKRILDRSNANLVMGIDVLEASVRWANQHWKNGRMKFQVGDAHKLECGDGTFDAVFALEVMEHVFEPEIVVEEIKRALKLGGYAVFLVPTDSIPFRIIWFLWKKSKGRIWDNTHIHSYKNNYLTQLARRIGFTIEEDRKFLLGMLQVMKVRKL